MVAREYGNERGSTVAFLAFISLLLDINPVHATETYLDELYICGHAVNHRSSKLLSDKSYQAPCVNIPQLRSCYGA